MISAFALWFYEWAVHAHKAKLAPMAMKGNLISPSWMYFSIGPNKHMNASVLLLLCVCTCVCFMH